MAEVAEFKNESELEDLRKSKDFLESLISNAPDIIYLLDDFGNIRYINDSIKNYGWIPSELIGKNILEIVHPDDKQKALYKINERRTGVRATKVLEIRLLTKENQIIPFETKITNYASEAVFQIDAQGIYKEGNILEQNFFGTHGVARDISIRKKMDKLLQKAYKNLELEVEKKTAELVDANSKLLTESSQKRRVEKRLIYENDRYKVLFNSIVDPMFVFDLETNIILEANDAACNTLKYTRTEIQNKTIIDITQSDSFFEIPFFDQKKLEKFLSTGTACFDTICIAKDDTNIALEMNAYVFSEKGKSKVILFAHNLKNKFLTERDLIEHSKNLEKVIDKQAKRIEYLEKTCKDKKLKIKG